MTDTGVSPSHHAVNMVIDLETHGTLPTSRILQIGAAMKEASLEITLPRHVPMEPRLGNPFTEDEATIAWWAHPDRAHAAKVVFDESTMAASYEAGIRGAHTNFSYAVDRHGKENVYVWGNGADFDLPILQHSFAVFGLPWPFDYRNHRCFRTYRAMFADIAKNTKPFRKGNMRYLPEHTAGADAIYEFEWLTAIEEYRYLRA